MTKYSNNILPDSKLVRLEAKLGYSFKNKDLLRGAMRHPSLRRNTSMFERLEFLGDRILGIVMAEYIFKTTVGAEGGMAKMHSAFVCAESCHEIALELGINKIIQTGGKKLKENHTVLADATEAVLGAVFIDSKSDYKLIQKLILRIWRQIIVKYNAEDQEPKTQLQEIVQALENNVPVYEVLEESGPKHQPKFTVQVSALGFKLTAIGHSKKDAETKAAREMLGLIK